MNEQLQTALLTASRIQRELLEALRHEYVGRDEVIDLLGLCLVAGENLFLLMASWNGQECDCAFPRSAAAGPRL